MKCAKCINKKCYFEGQNCTRMTIEDIKEAYQGDCHEIMKAAACTEGRFYNNLTRFQETVEFCKLMGCKKVGMAFCFGLNPEAALIEEYFSKHFEVFSVCCKVCGMSKESLDLEHIQAGVRETMCNPIMQAKLLKEKEVEFCITVGLCVGHDALFTRACGVPTTCMVVKDRVLAHNPLGAIYSRYWRKKLGLKVNDPA